MRQYPLILLFVMLCACNDSDDTTTTTGKSDTNTVQQETTEQPVAAPAERTPAPTRDTLADAFFKEVAREKPTLPDPDTLCFMMTEGANNEYTNAVKLILLQDKRTVLGELKYLTKGEPPATGNIKGTIRNNIITADWTFIKQDSLFYSVPVAFKLVKNAILQKPSALDSAGKPYIPKDGEYNFKFDKIDCSKYPE